MFLGAITALYGKKLGPAGLYTKSRNIECRIKGFRSTSRRGYYPDVMFSIPIDSVVDKLNMRLTIPWHILIKF